MLYYNKIFINAKEEEVMTVILHLIEANTIILQMFIFFRYFNIVQKLSKCCVTLPSDFSVNLRIENYADFLIISMYFM